MRGKCHGKVALPLLCWNWCTQPGAGHHEDSALQARRPLKEPRDKQTVRRNSSLGTYKASAKTCFAPEQVRLLRDLKMDNLLNSYQVLLCSRSRSYNRCQSTLFSHLPARAALRRYGERTDALLPGNASYTPCLLNQPSCQQAV